MVASSLTLTLVGVGALPAPIPERSLVIGRATAQEHRITRPSDPGTPNAAAERADHSSEMAQVIRVEVVGGSISVSPDRISVPLAWQGKQWSAPLPQIRLVDARGSLAGWTVTWSVEGVDAIGCRPRTLPPSQIRITPSIPLAIDGAPGGLAAGATAVGTQRHRILAVADPDHGGGTFEVGGTVAIQSAACRDASAVTVHLTFTLG